MANTNLYDDHVKYESYDNWANERALTRKARRKRKVKPTHVPKMSEDEIVASIAQTIGLEAGFDPTYTPSEHEAGWLLHALRSFYDEELITDVLAQVKGGKEANVYLCKAHETVNVPWLAAKVYRPRVFRTIRNDSTYRQGRAILTESGEEVKPREKRTMKAIQHKSGFGQYVSHQSWMAHEVATLDLLNDAGAPVPRVYSKSDNAILMSYIGNEQEAAPTLNNVNLTALHNGKEIYELFHKAIGCIELLLQHDRIHGDLSAYNILYWAGDITLIDFPQTIVASRNSQAQDILRRDVQRVCEYFQKQGVRCRPIPLADALWHQYVALSDMEREADLSRFEVEED